MKTYADIQGDGGSQVLEQVIAQREQIKARLSGVKNLLAIGSGKGGVGKSTLTMQLAASLASEGQKVAVFDLDFNGPTIARLAGLEEVEGLEQNVLAARGEAISLPQCDAGFGVLSIGSLLPDYRSLEFENISAGDSHTWRATKEFSMLAEMLANTNWGELDFLLFDLPPGAERTFQFAEFFGPEMKVILVTIPSSVSHGVVLRSINALENLPNKVLGYVENMSGYYCAESEEIKPLFPTSDKVTLPIPLLERVVFDPTLAQLCDQGVPLFSEGSQAVSSDNSSDKLSSEETILPSAKAVSALAQKVMQLLG